MTMGNQYNVYRALFLKNASFQLRQVKSNIFQIVLVGLLMGALIALFQAPFPETPPQLPEFQSNNVSMQSTTGVCPYYNPNTNPNACTSPIYNLFLYSDPNGVATELMNSGEEVSFIAYSPWDGNLNTSVPILQQVASLNDIINNYTSVQQALWGQYNKKTNVSRWEALTAGFTFDAVNPQSLKYSMQLPSENAYSASQTIQDEVTQNVFVQNWIMNSFLSRYTGINRTLTTIIQPFSQFDSNPYFSFSMFPNLIGIFFLPSTLIFMLPIFVYTIVHEKQERLVEMMKMMGISMPTYWISNYTFSFLFYCAVELVVIILGLAGGVQFFTKTNPAAYLILFFLYGLAQTSFAFFLSTFFSKAKTSVIVCYFIVMLISGIGSTVQMIQFKTGPTPWIFLMFPGFALARGIYLITYTLTGPIPYPLIDLAGHGYTPLAQTYVYLLFEAPIYLLLAWYLDCVLPRENGVNYSPLFPIKGLIEYVRNARKPKGTQEEKKSILSTDPGDETPIAADDVNAIEFEDEDCLRERRRVHSTANFLIKIIDLHKQYAGRAGQPAKIALGKFCLALEQGECLGLLGPNGAGKTTLISILCGLSTPSSGTAFVSGFDITTEMYKVHQILGFCPQHDILWADLTVEEHLLFYCRLKGYSKQNEFEHVQKIAADVGLGGPHLSKKVSELSGGMKRRLSISIALVGDSRLVLLDEPTTGLDPDTRRNVWDIINKYKESRSIIITTHNIDEADVLCSKIAIMSLGSLKCIGTSLYLKNKFGAGYKLSAHLSPEANVDDYKAWIQSMFKHTELDPAAGTVDFIIPAADMNVAHLFSVMKQNKQKFGVLEWAINQMSLEEVFLKMVAADESQF